MDVPVWILTLSFSESLNLLRRVQYFSGSPSMSQGQILCLWTSVLPRVSYSTPLSPLLHVNNISELVQEAVISWRDILTDKPMV